MFFWGDNGQNNLIWILNVFGGIQRTIIFYIFFYHSLYLFKHLFGTRVHSQLHAQMHNKHVYPFEVYIISIK